MDIEVLLARGLARFDASASSPPPSTTPTPEQQDAIKGALIIAVVWGHSAQLTTACLALRAALYYFHVAGFLLLPFTLPARQWQTSFVVDRTIRYLTPYALVFWFSALIHLAMFADLSGAWLANTALAFLIGSAELADRSTGFQLSWFLPALWSLTLLRSARVSLSLLGLLAICVHFGLGAVPEPWLPFIWANLGIAAFMLPLGELVSWLVRRRWATRLLAAPFWLVLAGFAIGVCLAKGSYFNLGKMAIPSYQDLPRLLLHDLAIVAAFMAFLSLSPLIARSGWIRLLGRHSLEIFLSHQFIMQGLWLVQRSLGLSPSSHLVYWASGIASLLVTLALSLGASLCLRRFPALRRLVLPRGLADWRAPIRPPVSQGVDSDRRGHGRDARISR